MSPTLNAPRKLGAITSIMLGYLAATAATLAQNAPEVTPTPPQSETRLEEVVVTAQKRTERLQEVPISAQVVSGETLAQQNLNTLETLAQLVPAVHIDATQGPANNVYIRGIGSGANQSLDQSAAMFVDDIYHGRSRMSAATFLDLERVEVLKGPQSTYFGNNAIAGAFNVVTRKPGRRFEASTRALYGEDGQYALEGLIGGPLTDTFGIRLAATANGQDGWLEDVNLDRDAPNENNRAGRLTLSFTPNERFDATLKIESSKKHNNGLAFQITECPRPLPYPPLDGNCGEAAAVGAPTGLDSNEIAHSGGERTDLDTQEAVLTASYQIAGHTLTSVAGYFGYDFNMNLDTDLLPSEGTNAQLPERYHQFSQELRITSAVGGAVEYLAGVYYQSDGLDFAQAFSFFFFGPFIGGVPPGQEVDYSQDAESRAVFGSVTWNAMERLKLTAGLRGSWVKKDFDYRLFYGAATQQYGGIEAYDGDLCTATAAPTGTQALLGTYPGLGLPCAFSGSRSDHAWLPSARIQYQITPAAMAYLRYDRGFKAGGFNGANNDTQGDPANLPFDPEHVHAYEVGVKSEWLDNTVLLNLSVFRMDYSDLQVQLVKSDPSAGFITLVQNAASSRSQGVELEAQWAVTRNFRLAADAAYLDSRYVDYPNASTSGLQGFCRDNPANAGCVARFPAGVGAFQDLSDTRTPFAPKWSGSLTGSYSMPLPRDYQLTTEVSGFASSDWYRDVVDEWAGSYVRLDGRLRLDWPDGRWALDLIGKNLSNRVVVANSLGSGVGAKQQPRNFAFQVRYNF